MDLIDPKFYPLQVRNILKKLLHAVLRLLPHGVGDCGVYVHCKGGAVMSKLLLHYLDRVSSLDGIDGVAMPI